jgi:hypothetical protein
MSTALVLALPHKALPLSFQFLFSEGHHSFGPATIVSDNNSTNSIQAKHNNLLHFF